MTEQQRQAIERARTRIARLQPELLTAVLIAFRAITNELTEGELARLIGIGAIGRILTELLSDVALDRATMPVRLAVRQTVATAFRWNVPYLPKGGKVNGRTAVVFDALRPRVIEAMRTLETRVITTLHQDVRDAVRQAFARGIEARQDRRAVARSIRSVVGLSARGEQAVANFRRMLETGDRAALARLLRDARFDRTLDKALGADGTGLSAAQVDTMVNAYRRRSVAAYAETISRTATRDAYKLATRESWESAIDRGIVPGDSVRKRWLHLDEQDNPRPHHAAMQGETVPIDARYSNGDAYAGEHDPWNCHCLDIFMIA